MSDRLGRRRVLVPPCREGDRVPLAEGEAHHLVRVLRARPGDVLSAVTPTGERFRAVVDAMGPSGIWLRMESRLTAEESFAGGPSLLVAPPHADRMSWLVEKAVELGSNRILPVATRRGVVRPGGEAQTERWRRVALAAVKQSGARPPEILPLRPLAEILKDLETDTPLLVAHPVPGSVPLADAMAALAPGALPVFAVGPEGGWTEEEIGLLEAARGRFVWLGRRTLRVETAALAVLAAWELRKN